MNISFSYSKDDFYVEKCVEANNNTANSNKNYWETLLFRRGKNKIKIYKFFLRELSKKNLLKVKIVDDFFLLYFDFNIMLKKNFFSWMKNIKI